MKSITVFSFFFFLGIPSVLFSQVPEMTENTNTAMSSILLNEMELMDYENIEKDILNTWDIQKNEINGNDQTISFEVDGVTYLVAMIPSPLPDEGLETAVEYSYLWKDARSALDNKSYIAIAVVGEKDLLDLYIGATKISAIILEHTNSSGIYLSGQSLVLSREFYIEEAKKMTADTLPLKLWVYIGMHQNEKGNSAYTFGLKEFGLQELEIVNSGKTVEEVTEYIYNMAHLALIEGIEKNDGNTTLGKENNKIKISLSNGINLGGQTYKIEY